MRLETVERGSSLRQKFMLAMVRLMAGIRVPDVLRVIVYRSEFFGKPFYALTQAARLVPIDSPDYQKVQKELEEVKAKLPKPQAQKPTVGEETLTLPTPPPEPKAKITPIELPQPEVTPTE